MHTCPPQAHETLLTSLLNDLTELPAGSVLVLDDYHAIEAPAIHQALALFTERLPATLHLVLATREDPPLPLARLRARGQISEVRAEQLRFAPAEALAFLTEVMGLSLSSVDVAALESRTEGWVAGLQLAALALRDTEDQRAFIAAFTGSNRFIVDYLADEVLSKQPAHIQTFLLQTSILDRMCGALCDAVLGLDDATGASIADARAHSQRVLEQLERTNLFVIPLDAERRWYRYHHLFAEVLRERLRRGAAPGAAAALHLRASAWYARAGLAPEAIQHALAAGVPDVAGRLIEAHGQQLIATGEIASLIRWLRLLPEATLREQPRLLVLLCWLLPNTGALDDVARFRADAEALLADTTDPTLRGELLAIQLQPLVFQDRNEEVIAIGRQVLEYLPSAHFFHSVSGVVTGLALLRQSRLAEAEHVLSQAVAAARARQSLYFIVSGLSRMALLAIERGQLARAERLIDEALDACRSTPTILSPIAGMALVVLGGARRLQGRWEEAIETLQHGLQLCGQLNAAPFFFLDGHTCLAELAARQGEYGVAFEQLALAEERVRRFGNPVFTDTIVAHRASIWRTQGDPRFAGWLAEQLQRPHTTLTAARDREYVTLVRGLIDADQLTAALGWIERLEAFAARTDRQRSAVDVLVLRALALDRQGDAGAAHTSIARALTLAAPMGYVSAFLEDGPRIPALLGRHAGHPAVRAHLGRIRDASPEMWRSGPADGDELRYADQLPGVAASERALIEPLTARELEILLLIADGASNSDIARRLIISIGTVKKHTSNILGKLQVQSRTQAIARARALNLL
jgi:LuxR family transcriptional regulator, maltose regulon positive regulatory protein